MANVPALFGFGRVEVSPRFGFKPSAMTASRPARRARWLFAAGLLLPITAQAQFGAPAPIVQPTTPSDRLAANLLILSQNPRDVIALTEAGRSAIAIGDGHAALAFFARAEELSPGDSRIKAGIGSALLLVDEPSEALKLYAEASSMGLPDREMVKDRGLAYDLLGDSRRAQRDYQLALRQSNDDEVTRRLALSLGISGDRDQGLKLLDPLLRKQDQAAWRARAFILAMNGNMKDAERIAGQVMPLGMADSLTPFLRRLASLNPAQRARAVNLGIMPDTGVRTAMVSTDTGFRPLDAGAAERMIPKEPEVAAVIETNGKRVKPSKAPRRRPGQDEQVAVAAPPPNIPVSVPAAANPPAGRFDQRIDTRLNTRIAAVDPSRLPPEVQAALAGKAIPIGKPVALSNGQVMPPPSPAAQPTIERAVVAKPAETVVASPPPPPPIFEVPSWRPAGTAPALAKPAPPVVVPNTPPPPPAVVAVAPPPPVIVSPPPPPPVVIAVVPPPPPPLPVQIAIVTPPPPSAPIPSVIGPPALSVREDSIPASSAPKPADVLIPAAAQPAPTLTPPVQIVAVPATPAPKLVGLSAIMADIVPEAESQAAPLPSPAQLRAARQASAKKAAAEAEAKAEKEQAAREAAEKAALAKRNPARVWVQVATGNNESGLSGTWKKLKEKAPDVFKGQSAASVPYKSTNRVLIGPFKSQTEARAMVNAMGKKGIQGSTFSSDAGQEVGRVGGK